MKRNLWARNNQKQIDLESTQAAFASQRQQLEALRNTIDDMCSGQEIGLDEFVNANKTIDNMVGLIKKAEDGKISEEELKKECLKTILAVSLFKRAYEKKLHSEPEEEPDHSNIDR